jgi:hypothetical protein
VILATRRFEIQPLRAEALPDAAAFLAPRRGNDGLATLRHLTWLLLENPLASAAPDHGLCVRNANGTVVGLLAAFPVAFRADDRRLFAMASGAYFVEPQARTLGFHLFKRHLRSPGVAFFFSTSCNAVSGPLWKAVGASTVTGSDVEYVLPLDFSAVLSAFIASRTSTPLVARGAKLLGGCARLLRPMRLAAADVTIEPSRDWEKLAALARRHRPLGCITADRSAAFLQWRYAPRAAGAAPEICLFRDRHGNEGWFSLSAAIRGGRARLRGRVIFDTIWPRDRMGFHTVLAAAARFAEADADVVYFRPRPGVDTIDRRPWIIRRRRETPSAFAVAAKGQPPLEPSMLDLVLADGDGGVPDSDR